MNARKRKKKYKKLLIKTFENHRKDLNDNPRWAFGDPIPVFNWTEELWPKDFDEANIAIQRMESRFFSN